jgi:hypothetical protein
MSVSDETAADLRRFELELLRCDAGEFGIVERYLDDEFIEIGSSGRIYDKRDAIEALRGATIGQAAATDFSFRELASDVVLVMYSVSHHSIPPVCTRRCSIWKMKDGMWKIVFHQGTVERSYESESSH